MVEFEKEQDKVYVPYCGGVEASIEKYPILKKMCVDESNWVSGFSSKKINKYVGFELVKYGADLKSDDINKLLAIAEKRGEINAN